MFRDALAWKFPFNLYQLLAQDLKQSQLDASSLKYGPRQRRCGGQKLDNRCCSAKIMRKGGLLTTVKGYRFCCTLAKTISSPRASASINLPYSETALMNCPRGVATTTTTLKRTMPSATKKKQKMLVHR